MGIPLRGTGSPLGARSTGFSGCSRVILWHVALAGDWKGPSPTVLGQPQESACCCMPSLCPLGGLHPRGREKGLWRRLFSQQSL